MQDRVFQLRDGWHCVVGGKTFGSWACREYAVAGMQVEQRRAKMRPGLTQEQWDEIVSDFCVAS